MMLGHPDLVEPHLVQQFHLLEHPTVELRLWPVQRRDIRRQVVGSKLQSVLLFPALQRIGVVCTRNTSCTSVAPRLCITAPPGIKMSLKRTAAPMPCRGVGIGGIDCQR